MTKVLLVTPSANDARWVKNVLLEIGIDNVIACPNTSDAINLLSAGNYSLVLTEAFLPALTGFDLKKLMDSFGYKIPVICFSEKISQSTEKEAGYVGVQAILPLDVMDECLPEVLKSLEIKA